MHDAWFQSMKEEAPMQPVNSTRVYDLIELLAKQTPKAIAISASGRTNLNYRSLLSQVDYTVGLLNEFGIGRNDRVAVLVPNAAEMATAFLGVSAATAAVPLNPRHRQNEYEKYLSAVWPRSASEI
jgi:acyl-CoA synthetase (AMP-forming)/AMP-acid ligase II